MKKIFSIFASLILTFGIAGCDFSFVPEDQKCQEDPSLCDTKLGDKDDSSQDTGNSETVNYCEENPSACITTIENNNTSTNEDLTEVYKRAVKSTVTVLTYNSKYSALSSGSGVIYATSSDENSVFVYTNAHVINGGSIYEIIYYNNIRVSASVLVEDGEEDVAVLKADIEPNNDYLEVSIGNSNKLEIGETIFSIGSPLGTNYRNTMTKGIVSGLNVEMTTDNDSDGEETTMYLIQTDAALSSGNSGGPMFNAKGEFIGINTLKLTESGSSVVEGFNFSIPVNHFIKVATELLKNGTYKRPLIGVQVMDIGELSLSTREKYDINVSLGLYIDSIVSGGACDGLIKAKRVITKINDVTIDSTSTFIAKLYDYLPGDKIFITTTDLNGLDSKTVEITLQ